MRTVRKSKRKRQQLESDALTPPEASNSRLWAKISQNHPNRRGHPRTSVIVDSLRGWLVDDCLSVILEFTPEEVVLVIGGRDGSGPTLATTEFLAPGQSQRIMRSELPVLRVPNMTLSRMSAGAVVVGDKVYVIGGFHISRTTVRTLREVEIYDIAASEWRPGPPMIAARQMVAALVHKNYIYAIGGARGSGFVIKSVERLNTAKIESEGWQLMSPMNNASTRQAAVVCDNRIYALNRWIERYDDEKDQWIKESRFPSNKMNRFRMSFAVVDNLIFMVHRKQALCYDVVHRTITPIYPLRFPRWATTRTAQTSWSWIVAGGHGHTSIKTPSTTVEVYDFAAGTWSVGTPLSVPRLSPASVGIVLT